MFPEGAPVVYDGEDFVCETCDLASPKKQSSFEEVERHAPPSYEHHVQAPQIESANIGEDSDNCKSNALLQTLSCIFNIVLINKSFSFKFPIKNCYIDTVDRYRYIFTNEIQF